MVLVITLGIGVAEEVGLLSAFMKKTILGTSPKIVTFMIMLIGILGSLASDAASIVIPSISGMIFLSIGKNPLVGIIAGYAATSAGFTANLFIAGTDSLLTGITNEVVSTASLPEESVTCNWYFMIVSTILLSLTGTLITEKIIYPMLCTSKCHINNNSDKITDIERKGLKSARNGLLFLIFIIAIIAYPENSVLRNPETGSLAVKSVLFQRIVPIIFLIFIITGICFGKTTGAIKNSSDIPVMMKKQ